MQKKQIKFKKATSNGVKFLLGKKIKMTQIFGAQEKVFPCTLILAGPCFVTQIKKQDGGKDGYEAIQIGFQEIKEKKIRKTEKQKPFRYLREIKKNIDISKYKIKDKIDVSIFEVDQDVKISGISKGKGFQGAVKRWGFSGMGASHGVKHHHRTLGSTGSAYPQRVIKGKKMPGRMGGNRVTVKNLKIIKIDKENNIIAVKGAVPGRRGTLLEIRG
ncbi:MAG: 50S ribosomal protein L3 [Candidatus Pacebacteria bacterium]|nr:50S ribosomal protein L3 [Candidatus Paceibacterota bacterium]